MAPDRGCTGIATRDVSFRGTRHKHARYLALERARPDRNGNAGRRHDAATPRILTRCHDLALPPPVKIKISDEAPTAHPLDGVRLGRFGA
jgi:hypothetical protein